MAQTDLLPPPKRPPHGDLAHQIEHAVDDELNETQDESGFDAIVNRTVEAIGAGVLLTMTGLVFVNAALRYTANISLLWSDELVIALIPWLAMTGLFLSVRRREVIRIEHFVQRFPPRVRRFLNAFAEFVCAVSFAYLCYVTFEYLSFFGNDRTVYLQIPQYWFHSSVLIGGLLITGAFLIDTYKSFRTADDGMKK